MNNDRLKFRVWNIQPHQYQNNLMIDEFGLLTFRGMTIPIDSENWVVETCTGLRDKNGNLIYKNDICRVKVASGGYETVLVVWDGAAWRFQCGPWVKLMCFWNPDEIEIIGNIHEQK